MRDDIEKIISEMISQTERKIHFLKKFLTAEHELGAILNTDFDNEPAAIIERQNDLITLINLQDYNISRLNDEFTKATGIRLSRHNTKVYSDEKGMFTSLYSLRSKEKKIISEISEMRTRNTELMYRLKDDTKKNADEIRRIIEIDLGISKDPLSSW